ncbi:MAG TPA: hypothetical protein VEF53_00725, partial [Patescibacteria group bacterium]|nr:hypothetical protein [Patescibacteria group bacterium]
EPEAIEKKLEQHGVSIKFASEFFPENWLEENDLKQYHYIRLCISGVPEEHLDALGTIVSVIGNC